MVRFSKLELPVAFSMVRAGRRLKKENDRHPFIKYNFYWAAFNEIYKIIGSTGIHAVTLKRDAAGNIKTKANGSVNIPRINPVSEQGLLSLAFQEFDPNLRHRLVIHDSTKFFAYRVPSLFGAKIEHDSNNQRVNGVLNINYTVDRQNPVWSPIDLPLYQYYLVNQNDNNSRNFVAKQTLDVLYTVRCNLVHGGKPYNDYNSVEVVENALPLLEMIVRSFIR